ncbi:MAG: zinc ribbon domain-containing protein [Ktedonobacterales bacterium]
MCQKLASRAFHAVLRVAIRKANHVRFKGKHQLDTVEGKSNETGLTWRSDRVLWKGLSVLAHLPRLREGQTLEQRDPVLAHGLASRVKYVRLVRRKIRGENRFSAQLICEGVPYQKPKHDLGEGIIGLDLGPSTIALVTPTEAALQPFCAELAYGERTVRRVARHLDRQRRANNPDNYLPDGRVKPGRKGRKHWRESVRQRRVQAHLADRQRRLAAHRTSLHGRIAHRLLRQGNVILVEKVSYRAWQRRFGRSVQRHAPGVFVTRLTRLAESAGAQVIQVPTRQTKLSQTCQCGQIKKKPLSLRVHECEVCGVHMQRDLYSAYLIQFIDPDTHLLYADQAVAAWPSREPVLRAAWRAGPNPQSNQQVLGRRLVLVVSAPYGGAVPSVRRSWSPATGMPANPRVRWCSAQRLRESQTAGAATAARTSRIHPGEWFSYYRYPPRRTRGRHRARP